MVAKKDEKKPLAAPDRFCHIVLKSTNRDRLQKWYEDALGMRVQHKSSGLTFMTYDDEHHRIAIAQVPRIFKRPSELQTGLAHFAFAHNTFEDLADAYEARKAKGIKPFWCVNHGMTISMYYADPDGNEVECQVDLLENEEANAFMAGPDFSQNPIGVDFEPEEFVRRVRAKLPTSELAPRRPMKRGIEDVPSPGGLPLIVRVLSTWGSTIIAFAAVATLAWEHQQDIIQLAQLAR
ncbi:Glyoxalase/Bleomycin resistance protein/Dihydroxybiphenyl dioxygenase [Gonapodya prolifera JEL478]|uniref:Glyoxalase/Bleomycin resistance protein/Dihydroxybiphenyl dioxygenase n=1 Tax=Gonapodya prolifera (strain JEL478) TaxID=1344416 RepID=A0A138ZXD5_GONPJ|nr:Glyoxalase/Bleomycin resistance protein/Dihydroxybiphenyl dioxygenase [Gonapodya prolifera JEL478]|eukprot:KXS09162.1 Glyoxalase/Bleomycin resistance protein/Dihydroxybiphenyl dioxygenase [Gonapodya prolifera JEL478]